MTIKQNNTDNGQESVASFEQYGLRFPNGDIAWADVDATFPDRQTLSMEGYGTVHMDPKSGYHSRDLRDFRARYISNVGKSHILVEDDDIEVVRRRVMIVLEEVRRHVTSPAV